MLQKSFSLADFKTWHTLKIQLRFFKDKELVELCSQLLERLQIEDNLKTALSVSIVNNHHIDICVDTKIIIICASVKRNNTYNCKVITMSGCNCANQNMRYMSIFVPHDLTSANIIDICST